MRAVIFGGTGTLGNALTDELLRTGRAEEVLIVSRCELKQKQMKGRISDKRVQFQLGDIRDPESVWRAVQGASSVFLTAALKHVDVLEENIEECIKTNITGALNVADACEMADVKYCVYSSTDKAVDAINVYGHCKAISEKAVLKRNERGKTRFSVYRWGNVISSRGSAFQFWAETLRNEGIAYITDKRMTRFWITIQDAAKFLVSSYQYASINDAMVPPIKAASVERMIAAVAREVGVRSYELRNTPIRPGEKLHEALHSIHSRTPLLSDSALQYSDEELDQLLEGASL